MDKIKTQYVCEESVTFVAEDSSGFAITVSMTREDVENLLNQMDDQREYFYSNEPENIACSITS